MLTRRSIIGLLAALAAAGCERNEADYRPEFAAGSGDAKKEYTFAVLPLHNPQLLHQAYGPVVDHLNARIDGVRFRLVVSRDYAEFEERLSTGAFDFAIANPFQTLESLNHGYSVLAKMGDDDQFRGIILTRKDSGIDSPADLRGKVVSYPAPTAVAGAMMPQWFLHTHGLGVADTTTRYVGSHESSIMNVYLGRSQAAATWPPPWEAYARAHPEVAAAVEVKWTTPPLVNNGLVVHRSAPPAVSQRVREVLLSLHETEAGRTLLKPLLVSRFESADAGNYAPVQAFLEGFESRVRPLAPIGKRG